MAMDRFLIGFADSSSGFQNDYKPWLIADNAFEILENAYVYRGRVRKRFGSTLMGLNQLNSRLRILLGNTDGSGNYSGSVPGVIFGIGQMFSVVSQLFTVYQLGIPAATLSTGTATATYNTTTGALTITGATVSSAVFFYPATPVMGITQYYEPDINDYITIGFDTQFSYYFDDTTNSWLMIDSGDDVWTGNDANFFWSTNYTIGITSVNTLWTTNFTSDDGIRYYDGSTWTEPILNYTKGSIIGTTDGSGDASGTLTGTFFLGEIFTIGMTTFTVSSSSGALTVSTGGTGTGTFDTATGDYTFTGAYPNNSIYFTGENYIETCRLIIEFKNRLLLFNTIESVDGTLTSFVNRVRWSAVGSPLTPTSWMQDFPGNGGALDADTFQSIITAQFIKDRLIVYFESSTFELAYTSNQTQPFTWRKLNTELGAESTFSQIPFDKVVLGIGNVGIHSCNGSNVDRIDSKIPFQVYSFHDGNSGIDRICGIRDYYTELAYWSFPSQNRDNNFYYPNQVLVYNYLNDSWAINDDSITSMGYYLLDLLAPGSTWQDTTTPWELNTNLWNSSADSQNTVKFKSVVAGNQEGFTFILRPDITENAAALQVTNVTVTAPGRMTISCVNHNLQFNDFVLFSNMNGLIFTDSNSAILAGAIGKVFIDPILAGTTNSLSVYLLDNAGQPIIITGTYKGGGLMSRVSEINIKTKQYNFYTSQDRSVYIPKVDFLVDKTNSGQITVDFLISSSTFSLLNEVISSGALPGTNILETSPYALVPFENFQTRLWHPLYFYAEGECVQLNLYFSQAQMYGYQLTDRGLVDFIALQDFQLHAMAFYATPTSNRMQ